MRTDSISASRSLLLIQARLTSISWKHAIYNINRTEPSETSAGPYLGNLTLPANKGHEAMAYLTYIVDHYHDLPSTLVFLHAHRDGNKAWHTDTPGHSNVASARTLRLPAVLRHGYVNLRCDPDPGCHPNDENGAHLVVTPDIWDGLFKDSSTPSWEFAAHLRGRGGEGSREAMNATSSTKARERKLVVPQISVACCAQFAISRETVMKRTRDDYIGFRQWLLDTDLPDSESGRVFEYLWHIIFGRDAI